MSHVSDTMAKLASKFQPNAAKDISIIYQINIEDDQPYHLVISDQECLVHQGEHLDPNVTLLMDTATFTDIVNGDIGGTTAYMSGRLRAEGDVMLATKLGQFFKR